MHTGQKRPISEGPGKGLRTGPGGPAAGDAVAQRLGRLPAAPEWQRIDFGSNRAPLGTRSPLNNAQMMRCAAHHKPSLVCDVLQRNGWCQSVQRLADAPEQLKHTSVALYHLPYRSITGGSRIATAPGEAGGLRSGWHALVACKCACISFFVQLMRVAIGVTGRDATCSTYRIHHSAILATNVMRAT